MTVTLTKGRLAVAIIAVAMLVPATAYALHVFDGVADDAFYADPGEWAFDNSILIVDQQHAGAAHVLRMAFHP